ncbi:hypothetical protein KTD18_16105 [Burkholderia multivorans]|nr:hypothetical protein [Burkholderia multivorans]
MRRTTRTRKPDMNEIKHTPGPWHIAGSGLSRYIEGRVRPGVLQEVAWCGATEVPGQMEANAHLIASAPDMALALEMIAAEDDAARHNGTPLLTSGVRMTLDAALIKAGRKEVPVPVRHVRICGEGL